jgi:hypothetical protein
LNVPIILPSLEDCVQSDSMKAKRFITISSDGQHRILVRFIAGRMLREVLRIARPKVPGRSQIPAPAVPSYSWNMLTGMVLKNY